MLRQHHRCHLQVLVLSLLCLVLASPCRAETHLTLGVHPYLSATEIYKRFTPLVDYLRHEVNIPISIAVSSSYESHVDGVGQGKVDLAFMGPAPYVRLTRQFGEVPLLAAFETNGRATFKGVIAVRKESPITTMAQLKGKIIAFGPPPSTMSNLVPRYLLLKEGLPLDQLGQTKFMTNHENIALGLLAGAFDAGAIKEDIFTQYQPQGLRALEMSEPLPDHLFVARKGLPDELVAQISSALLSLRQSEHGPQILTSLTNGLTALVPVKDADYDPIRAIIRFLEEHGEAP